MNGLVVACLRMKCDQVFCLYRKSSINPPGGLSFFGLSRGRLIGEGGIFKKLDDKDTPGESEKHGTFVGLWRRIK